MLKKECRYLFQKSAPGTAVHSGFYSENQRRKEKNQRKDIMGERSSHTALSRSERRKMALRITKKESDSGLIWSGVYEESGSVTLDNY